MQLSVASGVLLILAAKHTCYGNILHLFTVINILKVKSKKMCSLCYTVLQCTHAILVVSQCTNTKFKSKE